jgi:hypothetical protein
LPENENKWFYLRRQKVLSTKNNFRPNRDDIDHVCPNRGPEMAEVLGVPLDSRRHAQPCHVIVGNHLIAELDETCIVDNLPAFAEFRGLAIESDKPQGIAAGDLMLGAVTPSSLRASHC